MIFAEWAARTHEQFDPVPELWDVVESSFPAAMPMEISVEDRRLAGTGLARGHYTLLTTTHLVRIDLELPTRADLADSEPKVTICTWPLEYLIRVKCIAFTRATDPKLAVEFTLTFKPESGIEPLELVPDYVHIMPEAIEQYCRVGQFLSRALLVTESSEGDM